MGGMRKWQIGVGEEDGEEKATKQEKNTKLNKKITPQGVAEKNVNPRP